jgi:polysaccharide biosynthesis/export protein
MTDRRSLAKVDDLANKSARVRNAAARRARASHRFALAACAVLLAAGAGCATTAQGPFVWVDQIKEPTVAVSAGDYLIGPGDALNVQVWEQDKMSARVRVRTDGQISLPFLNDVPAAGKTPVLLARDLEARFKQFIVSPQVTVAVDEATPLRVSVLGEVGEPGLHNLEPGAGVAQALAAAGGLKEFAHKDRIFVLRQGEDKPQRIRMTYESLTGAQGRAATLRLQTGDVVVVE